MHIGLTYGVVLKLSTSYVHSYALGLTYDVAL